MNAAYLTPAITLFNEDGSLDLVSQEKLFNSLIENGIDGILVEGSSSEFFAMPMDQRREMAKFAIEAVDHRVKLIIGTSHMVADEIVSFSNFCLDAGADAVMILPPYYFHFGAEALLQYYDRLASQIHGNIYIYNFPDNTGYTIPPETVLSLAKIHPNIVGMKDTISGMDHTRELIKVVKSHIPSFEIYSGFDDNFAHNVMAGGNGCIGALSNVVPEICSAWVKAFRDNDMAGVAKGQQTIDRLMDLYAVRSPFLPVIKEACKLRGIASTSVGTFPMPNATVEDDAKILELLRRLNRERGITVVLITHHMAEAESADRVIVMNDGQVAMDGAPHDVFAQVDRLHELGLAAPDTVELLHLLREAGMDVPLTGLTVDECADTICRAFGGAEGK